MSGPRCRLFVFAGVLLGAALFLTWGAVSVSPATGDPLAGLTADQLALFDAGKEEFQNVDAISDGLGPTFNGTSCAGCHSAGGVGGASNVEFVTRYGRTVNGKFDPMAEFGGSLIHSKGIGPVGSCNIVGETVPAQATIRAHRRTTALFGLGLVDAVPDSTFEAIALIERVLAPSTAGKVNHVTNLVAGHKTVGKFGWKAQQPSLFQFSGDAYLNEMGITTPLFPHEHCPQGDCSSLVCDPKADPEDAGGVDMQKFTDFMTMLAPPQRGAITSDVKRGEILFFLTGCASCHNPTLVTGKSPIKALDHVTFFPFSDFLLHDMGSLGDGIEQEQATGREMRTVPLWGVGLVTKLLHDGRATTLEQAILMHDGQGRHARDEFNELPAVQKGYLIAFLKSL